MTKPGKHERERSRQADIDRIAARLRLLRGALGLKSSQLCKATGIARNTYSQWENGKGRPPLDQARVLRAVFGVSLDWLYEGDRASLPLQLAQKITNYEMSDENPQKSSEKVA